MRQALLDALVPEAVPMLHAWLEGKTFSDEDVDTDQVISFLEETATSDSRATQALIDVYPNAGSRSQRIAGALERIVVRADCACHSAQLELMAHLGDAKWID
ncbi:MAG: hypothetical protein ABSH46_08520 [Bryobacteraceae bacterium]